MRNPVPGAATMITVEIEPRFEGWRSEARRLVAEGMHPDDLIWNDGTDGQAELFGGADRAHQRAPDETNGAIVRVGRRFMEGARLVACHRDETRWALLYRVLYRMVREGERHLLDVDSDADVRRMFEMAKAVRRDCHKMTAFVRFRKVGEAPGGGRERFVAWFEPDHHIVERCAPFFAKRFTGMDWSILTPERCAHWDGWRLWFSEGADASAAPTEDALDEIWRSYYKSIFNPARLKVNAMKAEMPQKYWKNLPEARLIPGLIAEAPRRVSEMVRRPPTEAKPRPPSRYLDSLDALAGMEDGGPAGASAVGSAAAEARSMDALRRSAMRCRACALCQRATQTVFGHGAERASIMLVGEQPGDQEDVAGRPFVGPAGQLLDRALAEAGVRREDVYTSNVVKHFKWSPRGKRRLHETPNSEEIGTCRPWLDAEIRLVRPKVLVCLGNTAAQALIGPGFRVTKDRGIAPVHRAGAVGRVIGTVHPSMILRIPVKEAAEAEYSRLVEDLRLAVVGESDN